MLLPTAMQPPHNAKGKRKCSHKVNVPFPGKAFKVAKDSLEAITVDKLAIPFCWNKMHFTKETVSIVTYLAVICAIPATQVAQICKQLFNVAFENSPSLRKANVVTDGPHSCPCALDDLKYETEKRHIRYVGWDWDLVKKVDNNRLERHMSSILTGCPNIIRHLYDKEPPMPRANPF